MELDLSRLAEGAQLNRGTGGVMLTHLWMAEEEKTSILAGCLALSIAEHRNCSRDDLDVRVAEYDDGTVEVTIAPVS